MTLVGNPLLLNTSHLFNFLEPQDVHRVVIIIPSDARQDVVNASGMWTIELYGGDLVAYTRMAPAPAADKGSGGGSASAGVAAVYPGPSPEGLSLQWAWSGGRAPPSAPVCVASEAGNATALQPWWFLHAGCPVEWGALHPTLLGGGADGGGIGPAGPAAPLVSAAAAPLANITVTIPELEVETHILALLFDRCQLVWERESVRAKARLRSLIDALVPSLDRVVDQAAGNGGGAGPHGRASGRGAPALPAASPPPPEPVDVDAPAVVHSEEIVEAISSVRHQVHAAPHALLRRTVLWGVGVPCRGGGGHAARCERGRHVCPVCCPAPAWLPAWPRCAPHPPPPPPPLPLALHRCRPCTAGRGWLVHVPQPPSPSRRVALPARPGPCVCVTAGLVPVHPGRRHPEPVPAVVGPAPHRRPAGHSRGWRRHHRGPAGGHRRCGHHRHAGH